jgi:hypothetical protein
VTFVANHLSDDLATLTLKDEFSLPLKEEPASSMPAKSADEINLT